MKKSFKGNPALQFLTKEQPITVETEAPKEYETTRQLATDKGYPVKPLYVETKSKRFNLLLQPSLYDRLSEAAERQHTSKNDLINVIIREYLEGSGKQ